MSSRRRVRTQGVSGSNVAHVIDSPNRPSPSLKDSELRRSLDLWNDITTMRWMTRPSSSFKLLMIPVVGWAILHFLGLPNPFEPMLFLSYYLPDSEPGFPKFAKGPLDILFIAYYVIIFSFIRQSWVLKILRPLARRLGIKKPAKLDRFAEQGYTAIYFSFFGLLGVYVMSQLPTWWYRTEHFWLEYPHWRMTPLLKRYYLMQLSYWVQQLFVLILRLEKPRKDFAELVIHHFVTIWLVGWSYAINLTWIGNAVFLTMDVSDIFLAISKVCNYLRLEKTTNVIFAFFICVWSYLRHYLNIIILWSVWTQFDLIPDQAKRFTPRDGVWMVWWMKYQIFIPILLLQLVNIFWYFLIWRVLFRALFQKKLADERSDDEDED
ncbi:longevity assurance proteins LAG1/LAC1 [Cantharellus anzutake]|uniref:longevity assurance proteins LAG1/LAC1 n=1 Tax=Cantharellus anzutake TaxID=1750568 RepID=UPI00190728EE|nr:longevity assurance proteins LAG1/LAC1 [Cantharellus anzutake]KAF8335050.1 longevity assurance proteins LAG1/LAC1 [Cantharellus anzutake]